MKRNLKLEERIKYKYIHFTHPYGGMALDGVKGDELKQVKIECEYMNQFPELFGKHFFNQVNKEKEKNNNNKCSIN